MGWRLPVYLALLLVGAHARAQDPPVAAWWLSARFEPMQTSYQGLKASDIDPAWVGMAVLDASGMPPEARADLDWMRRHGFGFVKEGDFGGDGHHDRAVAGVYEDRAGRKGRFLLVLESGKGKVWRPAFLHEEAGEAGFSVLVVKRHQLFWGTCWQCGDFSRLRKRKDGSGFFLETPP